MAASDTPLPLMRLSTTLCARGKWVHERTKKEAASRGGEEPEEDKEVKKRAVHIVAEKHSFASMSFNKWGVPIK